ncbi:MAG: transcriptional regulator [Planctomycetes bacterium]|nr:transcriptional regulator [Planctomycetota bacterium]
MRSSDFLATHAVFTQAEFVSARASEGGSARTADSLLARQLAAGRLLHVRRGLYATVPPGASPATFQPDPYLVATKLADDAALAYHAALQFRGKTYSVWHRFTVLTKTRLRPLHFRGDDFVGVNPPRALHGLPEHGGGVVTEPHAGGVVRVTSVERTLVDLLDRPDLGGGWEEVWRSLEMVEFFDLDAVVSHALRRSSALLAARVGYFLEEHRDALFVEDRHLEPMRQHAPKQPIYLDRKREPGRLVKAWNLVVPARVSERTWAEVS